MRTAVSTLRVFLSFDLRHDQDLHDRLLAESKLGSSFSIASRSEPGNPGPESDERVRARIAAADAVIVICGEHTDESVGVGSELRIAQEQDKPSLLLWGRRERMCKKPASARNADSMYSWTADTLRSQIQVVLRAGRPREVPEHLRRRPPFTKPSD